MTALLAKLAAATLILQGMLLQLHHIQPVVFGGVDVPISIEAQMVGKDSAEKANIKADAIVATALTGLHESTTYGVSFDIQSVSKIEGGVEIFARAWKGAEQLGFGVDGSVDIERFRIMNPPILVKDPDGTVIKTGKLPNGDTVNLTFREDPKEAALLSLAHTIKLVGKTGTKIEAGKIGHTTSTFNPAACTSSTSMDGLTRQNGVADTWANIRGYASSPNPSCDDTLEYFLNNSKSGSNFTLDRSIFTFDTSSLTSGATISSAVFSVFDYNPVAPANADTTALDIVSATPAANNSITGADYAAVGSTVFASMNISSWTRDAYNDFNLDSNGIANISKTGYSAFGGRGALDVSNTAPTGNNYTYMEYADDAANLPKLVVTYTTATAAVAVPTPSILFFQ